MPRKIYNKLIRDKIPEIIRADDATPKVRELSGAEYEKALREKLIEEAQEVVEAKDKKEVLKELADTLELIVTVAKQNGISFEDIEKKRAERRKDRGGFDKKLFLEYVDE